MPTVNFISILMQGTIRGPVDLHLLLGELSLIGSGTETPALSSFSVVIGDVFSASLPADIPGGAVRALLIAGALMVFVFGMKTMSEGIQAGAGANLRRALESITGNRWMGALSGFSVTSLLQSSSATTVMIVSFVNAGLITTAQSAGIVLGSNVGTTVTAWLISVLGFRAGLSQYALILFALVTPLLMMRRSRVRIWRTPLIGFALMFIGLGFMMAVVPTASEAPWLHAFIDGQIHDGFSGLLTFIALGVILAVLVQSSSSAIALTMALSLSGIMPLTAGAAIILGANIGTTVTAEFAALAGNVHAKRSARIHTLFNILGAIWMVFALHWTLDLIKSVMVTDPTAPTEAGRAASTTALAAFHTIFNVANFALFIWLTPLLTRWAAATVPSRGGTDEESKLAFIDSTINVSEISLLEVRREMVRFGEITRRMAHMARILLTEADPTERDKWHERITHYENVTDRLEIEIVSYCLKLSTTKLTASASEHVRALLSISGELERIGDTYFHISKTIRRKNDSRVWFTPDQRQRLLEMMDQVDAAAEIMMHNLRADMDKRVDVAPAKKAELEINHTRNRLRKEHIHRIEEGMDNFRSGTVYSELFNALEKIGNHIVNVSEALAGEV